MLDTLARLFLPHHSNNHRAKLLHHSSLVLLIAALFVTSGLFTFLARNNEAVLGISYSITPEELLLLTNIKRQEHGLPVLTLNTSLMDAASRKAADMFAKNYWAHIAPDGTTPWYFIRSSGYEYNFAGENLARGFTTSEEVINAWMASPTHRDNMLSPNYKEIGFAIMEGTLTGDETVLVVEQFGSPVHNIAGTQAQEQADPPPAPQPSITQAPVALTITTPTPVPEVTLTPTPTPTPGGEQLINVAAYRNDPLINKPAAQKNIALIIVAGLLVLLLLDILIVERRGIVRILSHNIDHIIFFGMILLLVILVTKGGIL